MTSSLFCECRWHFRTDRGMLASKRLFTLSRLALLVIFFLAPACNGTLLDLPVGFNLSVRAALHSYGTLIKAHSAVDGHAFFVPFLSSSTFNSTNTSESLGFALGFLFLNGSGVKASLAIDRQELEDGIYLAVCGGMSGNHSNLIKRKLPFLSGVHDAESDASLHIIADGYVVPVWIAKATRPLKSLNASLIIVETQVGSTITKKELQLQDFDSNAVVWTINNAGMMEMQDSGNLVVWDSKNKTYVMWDSDTESTNTLVQGKKLLVGKELTSTSGDYSAQMKNGGLVLVLNAVELVDGQPSPYWIFPIHFRNDTYGSNGDVLLNPPNATSINALIASTPCASMNADDKAFGMLGNASLKVFLEAGTCSKDPSFHGAQRAFVATGRDDDFPISWGFLKLENDGRLYVNAVIDNNSTVLAGTSAVLRYALDFGESVFSVEGSVRNWSIAIQDAAPFLWDGCDVPMACGSFGVCTPQTSSFCSCPSPDYFKPIDQEDPSQGCEPLSSLPACTSDVYTDNEQHMFEFLQIRASSILLLGEWEYASAITTVDLCKKACSSDCACVGFLHNRETRNCFFLRSSKISFLNSTESFSFVSLVDLSKTGYSRGYANAGSYTSFLKINSVASSNPSIGLRLIVLITIFTTLAVVLLILVLCCFIRGRRRRRRKQRNRQIEEEELRDILPLLPVRFSYKELQEATNGFGKLLGAGGCGSVYAGVLSDGRKVAVKVLESRMQSGQSKQFLAEVATVGRTNHLNVVRLVGFCWEVSHRLLVYEFVERGSLDQWLFIKGSGISHNGLPAVLDWQTRYDVALGIVRGLSYLHEECAPPVLHFDIKPQNILLDETFVAKLADFGMSRLMQRGLSKVVTGVRGTPGYIAPEWLAHGAVSKKSDVYSMGMVFLEIVGGRKNVDLAQLDADPLNAAKHEAWHFPSWAAKKCEEGLVMELVDERLHTSGFDVEQAQKLIHTAFWCIQDDPSLRPYAPTVLQWLEGDSPVKQPPFNLFSISAHARSGSFTSSS